MKKNKNPKPDQERAEAFKSLPPNIKASLTEEEIHAFLYEEVWPDSLFEKLNEFMVKPD